MKIMFRRLGLLFLVVFSVANSATPAARRDTRVRKKLIATGWDHADSQRLLENLEQMEKRPFDGIVLQVVGRTEKSRPVPMRRAFVNEPWKRQWFQPLVDRVQSCKFNQFTDNFILLGANPGNVDWFDDEGWQQIADHWRIAAGVTKQSGFKGILFDPEPYTRPYAQFRYAAQPGHEKRTFEEYCSKVRQRGREVILAVVEEYPDITIFCYFMNSVTASAAGHRSPQAALATMSYGLLPAFIDGWLDVAPPTVTFVDGCESAYRYNSEREYLEAAVRIKGACQQLVSAENRPKYRAQVQVGYGVYLDAYWNPLGPWYIDGLGGPRVERLRENVRTALRVADEYVWVYGEKFRWWPTPNERVGKETWPEALPGCEDILSYVRDPIDYARVKISTLKRAGKAVNLARNGSFGLEAIELPEGGKERWTEGHPPVGWGEWQEDSSHGTLTWEREVGAGSNGAAKLVNVSQGCFIQGRDASPGERYAVRAVRRIQGQGNAWLRVRWKTADDHWTAEDQDVLILCDGPPEEWTEMLGVAKVPEGAARLVILLGVSGQRTPDDSAWYDDVELYKLN